MNNDRGQADPADGLGGPQGANDDRDSILVLGDWVVDEYWFLVRHNSDRSAHTGFAHYRMSNEQNDVVADLCGAGHIASLLYRLNQAAGRPFRLIGLGLWNSSDTRHILHLIHARHVECPSNRATFSLAPSMCPDEPDMRLVTMHPDHPTIRVVRSYHEGAGGLEQINRVDWEPGRKGQPNIDWHSFQEQLPEHVRAIVVHDRQKGGVTEKLVASLLAKYPKADWYVKSTGGKPAWIDRLDGALRLLLIGREVASLANPWGRWLVEETMGLRALEMVESNSAPITMLVSDQREVIARAGDKCVLGRSKASFTAVEQLGWSSGFFAAIVFRLLDSRALGAIEVTQDDVDFAIAQADLNAGVPAPARLRKNPPAAPRPQVVESNWTAEKNAWSQATRDLGLIRDTDGALRLDVWRGSTQIPGYVACINKKKEIIDEIGKAVSAFASNRSHNRKSLSILLTADPGSGKTFLAKSLARTLGFSYLGYDITQMVHREEILDTFDMVATTQANANVPVLVFVDEINAQLDGSSVYGAFLSPLEDGVYLRRGNAHTLQPCIWLFAGTKIDGPTDPSQKVSDFMSRMSMVSHLDFASLHKASEDKGQVGPQAQLEQVYLGASMIRKHFSDVQMVARDVLDRFRILDPASSPARQIFRMASSLQNVQYGQVTRDNCAAWEAAWPPAAPETTEMVRLVFE